MKVLEAPSASFDIELLADWMEVCALTDRDGRCSVEDLVSALRTTGSIDAIDDDPDADSGSEETQSIAESAFGLIAQRSASIQAKKYPFELVNMRIEVTDGGRQSTYAFLVLSSYLGGQTGSSLSSYTRLFEDISAQAARNYFGGNATSAVLYQMGWPRRAGQPTAFSEAVNQMMRHMKEGGAVKDRPGTDEHKDGKLDIAVWIPMSDDRAGKVIGFAQCATGNNWKEKIYELQPDNWCRAWLTETPAVLPLPMFFLPHSISADSWFRVSTYAGVVFDRVRIASHTDTLPDALRLQVESWTSTALSEYEVAVA